MLKHSVICQSHTLNNEQYQSLSHAEKMGDVSQCQYVEQLMIPVSIRCCNNEQCQSVSDVEQLVIAVSATR